jgi:uracil-DNA glycosylase family 4
MPSLPGHNCPRCPRLEAFRKSNRANFTDWHNAPVPSFGDRQGKLLIVGLAPGLRGANRTGRPFTGDHAGDLLYDTLETFHFLIGHYDRRPDDGIQLTGARITNAVRCVPPKNKPVGAEILACMPFLTTEISTLPRLEIILALGTVAHGAVLASLGLPKSSAAFSHGAVHPLPGGRKLVDSYHCSRYNTNTGRLTKTMFNDVFAQIRQFLDS